ncbi:MAG TPA: hypothetical protein VIM28_06460 [Solirubrobacterales bacterium]
MRRGLSLVLAMIAALLVTANAASAVSCTLSSCPGFQTLVATLGATVSPSKLPRNDYMPITANLFGKISTRNGTHPPAFREAVVDIDKDVKVNANGYPVCKAGSRDVRDPAAAKRACGNTILGEGKAEVEIAFPEQKPIKVPSPLLVFNGGEKGGKVTLLIHAVIPVPAPTAIITTVTITRKGSGIHAVAQIPVIAGGSGSFLSFSFKLGRTYSYKGKKVGYFEAKCPDGVFKVNVPSAIFKNEAHTSGQESSFNLKGKLAVPCTPYG